MVGFFCLNFFRVYGKPIYQLSLCGENSNAINFHSVKKALSSDSLFVQIDPRSHDARISLNLRRNSVILNSQKGSGNYRGIFSQFEFVFVKYTLYR